MFTNQDNSKINQPELNPFSSFISDFLKTIGLPEQEEEKNKELEEAKINELIDSIIKQPPKPSQPSIGKLAWWATPLYQYSEALKHTALPLATGIAEGLLKEIGGALVELPEAVMTASKRTIESMPEILKKPYTNPIWYALGKLVASEKYENVQQKLLKAQEEYYTATEKMVEPLQKLYPKNFLTKFFEELGAVAPGVLAIKSLGSLGLIHYSALQAGIRSDFQTLPTIKGAAQGALLHLIFQGITFLPPLYQPPAGAAVFAAMEPGDLEEKGRAALRGALLTVPIKRAPAIQIRQKAIQEMAKEAVKNPGRLFRSLPINPNAIDFGKKYLLVDLESYAKLLKTEPDLQALMLRTVENQPVIPLPLTPDMKLNENIIRGVEYLKENRALARFSISEGTPYTEKTKAVCVNIFPERTQVASVESFGDWTLLNFISKNMDLLSQPDYLARVRTVNDRVFMEVLFKAENEVEAKKFGLATNQKEIESLTQGVVFDATPTFKSSLSLEELAQIKSRLALPIGDRILAYKVTPTAKKKSQLVEALEKEADNFLIYEGKPRKAGEQAEINLTELNPLIITAKDFDKTLNEYKKFIIKNPFRIEIAKRRLIGNLLQQTTEDGRPINSLIVVLKKGDEYQFRLFDFRKVMEPYRDYPKLEETNPELPPPDVRLTELTKDNLWIDVFIPERALKDGELQPHNAKAGQHATNVPFETDNPILYPNKQKRLSGFAVYSQNKLEEILSKRPNLYRVKISESDLAFIDPTKITSKEEFESLVKDKIGWYNLQTHEVILLKPVTPQEKVVVKLDQYGKNTVSQLFKLIEKQQDVSNFGVFDYLDNWFYQNSLKLAQEKAVNLATAHDLAPIAKLGEEGEMLPAWVARELLTYQDLKKVPSLTNLNRIIYEFPALKEYIYEPLKKGTLMNFLITSYVNGRIKVWQEQLKNNPESLIRIRVWTVHKNLESNYDLLMQRYYTFMRDILSTLPTKEERISFLLEKFTGHPQPPTLTPLEQRIANEYLDVLKELFPFINYARKVQGLPEIEPLKDYVPFTHDRNELAEIMKTAVTENEPYALMFSSSTFFQFMLQRKAVGKLELNPFSVLQEYGRQLAHYASTAVPLARIKLLEKPIIVRLSREGEPTEFPVVIDFTRRLPNIMSVLTNDLKNFAIIRQGGLLELPFLPRGVRQTLDKLLNNMNIAILAWNLRTVLVQTGAVWHTASLLPIKYVIEGYTGLFDEALCKKITKEVKTLVPRIGEQEVQILLEKAEQQRLLTKGKITRLKAEAAKYGLEAMIDLDYTTALSSAIAAYKYAKAPKWEGGLGLSETEAIKFAEDFVVRTQASAARHDLARIQQGIGGRLLTRLQTFVIAEWNWLKFDVFNKRLTPNIPKEPTPQAIKTIMRMIIGAVLLSTLYEDILHLVSPIPSPWKPIISGIREEKKAGEVIGQTAKEMLEIVPIFGSSLRYSTSYQALLPSAAETIASAYRTSAKAMGSGSLKPFVERQSVETVAKLLGIPGAQQIIKTVSRWKYDDMSLIEKIMGALPPQARDDSLLKLMKDIYNDLQTKKEYRDMLQLFLKTIEKMNKEDYNEQIK